MAPRAQGNSTPKRFRSLSRSPGFFGRGAGGGPPGAPAGAGGCMAWYSSAGISMWRGTTLVRPKRSASAAFPLASPSSGAPDSGNGRAGEEDRGADQGRRCGEGSSMHGVTSRGDDRRADEGPSSLGSGAIRLPTTPLSGKMRFTALCRAPIVRIFCGRPASDTESGNQSQVRSSGERH